MNGRAVAGLPVKSIVAAINTSKGIPDAYGRTVAGAGFFAPFGIPSTSVYSAFTGTRTESGPYPANPIPGGIYYADTVLTDPSLDGDFQSLRSYMSEAKDAFTRPSEQGKPIPARP